MDTIFTEASVKKYLLPAEGEQMEYFEKLRQGRRLVLRISYGGTKAWRVVWYVNGKARAKTIGRWPDMSVKVAREAAYNFDPKAAMASAAAGSFKAVAESFIKHHVHAKKLLSKDEIERMLKVYVYPEWETRPFFEIRRGDVNALLDKIVERNGASQADGVLATLRKLCNWYETRDENYVSPIVRGMKRDQRPADERKRKRTLTDDEIRALWSACGDAGTYGAFLRILLLTAQRKEKVETMRWRDIKDGVWTVPVKSPREKGHVGRVKLPQMALDIIEAQPEIEGNPYVFAASVGDGPFNSFSQRKEELDAKLKILAWTQHDLRRTAKSLMARAGVADNIAERTLGHAIAGVEGVYNRYDYFEEKGKTLDALAALVGTILNPPAKDNVVDLAARR
ncbi:MAG TPA: tyrosine-type recombinase/integrase [Pseudolabrys sp.]|nr:tyrosine-type recombinase/integrase [Pseudolabrys sp.]